jgi:uncharacterized protein
MAISAKLLEILACPVCKTAVEPVLDTDALKCPSCKRFFPIHDGIPVMLVEDSIAPPESA